MIKWRLIKRAFIITVDEIALEATEGLSLAVTALYLPFSPSLGLSMWSMSLLCHMLFLRITYFYLT